MAMIACPECETQVSDTAFKCLKCGVELRKPKRSFMGKVFKWSFVAFNVLMLLWVVSGFNASTEKMAGLSGSEHAGAAIGTGIGIVLLMLLWAIGDVILGMLVLFTRPKT
jgi:hypothetical protein